MSDLEVLPVDWQSCYNGCDFSKHSDPSIKNMFMLLSRKNFPEIPREIFFDSENALESTGKNTYDYFSIIWNRFFVVIDVKPRNGSSINYLITVKDTGLIIEYDTVEKVVKHLIGNQKFYCDY